MELGFQANVGPLSQVSLQLFSPETAVYLATKAFKWFKARRQRDSLQFVLEAAGTSLVPIGAFNAEKYSRIRSQYPVFGVARQEEGRFKSLALPIASNSTKGDTGLWCLYGMITALLCFFNEEATCTIIMDILPHILHYDQEDHGISEQGPLNSVVKAIIYQIAAEEKTSKATESLLRHIEEKQVSVSTRSLKHIWAGHAVDSKLVSSFLLWLSVDYSKRTKHLYPTRSFLVWAIAEVLEELGFGIHAYDDPVMTKEQYKHIFGHETRYTHELEVYFIPTAVGDTDPDVQIGPSLTTVSHVRLLPIRVIPITELRQHFPMDGANVEHISKVWEFTFNHVQKYLRVQPHIMDMIGSSKEHERSTEQEPSTLGRHRARGLGVMSKQHRKSLPEPLEHMLARPILKYIRNRDCDDCIGQVHQDFTDEWCWTDDAEDEAARPRQEHNKAQKLIMKSILLATGYAIACLFVKWRRFCRA